MSRGLPSMTALLSLLAVAGYQHRDKIGEMLKGLGGGSAYPPDRPEGKEGPGPVREEGGIAGVLGGGLKEILDRFRQAGDGDTADSWVRQGPNSPLQSTQVERALGEDTIEQIARATGLPRADIIARLTRELPDAVDKYTPDGRIPDVA